MIRKWICYFFFKKKTKKNITLLSILPYVPIMKGGDVGLAWVPHVHESRKLHSRVQQQHANQYRVSCGRHDNLIFLTKTIVSCTIHSKTIKCSFTFANQTILMMSNIHFAVVDQHKEVITPPSLWTLGVQHTTIPFSYEHKKPSMNQAWVNRNESTLNM